MRRLTTLLAMAFAATVLLAACGGGDADDLIGKNWQLVAITDKVPAFQGVVPPADQAKFTITFNENKTFNSTVDCNKLAGTYKTTGPGRPGDHARSHDDGPMRGGLVRHPVRERPGQGLDLQGRG